MWIAERVGNDNYALKMAEGDWGISLPITIDGPAFSEHDELKFVLKTAVNGATLIEKTYTDIVDNTISLELTEEESAILSVGAYVYSLDWFQNGTFLCNIVLRSLFKVVDKA